MSFIKALEGIRTPFLDSFFSIATIFGEETVVMILLCVLIWCVDKEKAYGIGVAFLLSGLAVQVLKISFRIDRPWLIDPSFSPVSSAIAQATGYSFPSGHTQSAAAFYGSVGIAAKDKAISAACCIIVSLVAFSRLYLGVHTLQDVVVSLLLSLLFVLLSAKAFPYNGYPKSKKRELVVSSLIVSYSLAAIAIGLTLLRNGRIEAAYASDSLKGASAGISYGIGIYLEHVYINYSVQAQSILRQFGKFIAGLAGLLLIREGLKLIAGPGLIVDSFRYSLMILWVTVFFPLVIKRCFAVQKPMSTS